MGWGSERADPKLQAPVYDSFPFLALEEGARKRRWECGFTKPRLA